MPGEQEYYKSELQVFDISSKEVINVKLNTAKQQSINVYRHRYKKPEAGDKFKPPLLLSKKGKICFFTISRDHKKLDICVADINTGDVEVLIEERFNTYIEEQQLVLFNNETESYPLLEYVYPGP